MKNLKLNDGNEIPILGLGTWQTEKGECYDVVKRAIKVGYRHFDCAYLYQNEEEIGIAVRDAIKSGIVTRDQLFLTGKSWGTYRTKERVVEGCKKSLKFLGLDYFDLYLIHFPVALKQDDNELIPAKENGQFICDDSIDYLESWKGMEVLFKNRLTKSIGVSNFNKEQLTRLCYKCHIKPVMNQVECHPYLNQTDLIETGRKFGVELTAYSPLTSPTRNPLAFTNDVPKLFDNPVLLEIGKKHNRSPAQVALRYQVQRNVALIPKSTSEKHLKDNFQILDFTLREEDMKKINSLDINGRAFLVPGFKEGKYYPW